MFFPIFWELALKMNRVFNARLVKLLSQRSVNYLSKSNLSYVKKSNISENAVKSISLGAPRNYCSTNLGFDGNEWMDEALFKKITQNDPELETRVKLLLCEMESLKSDGELLPKKMTERHWNELLLLHSHFKKKRYFVYLAKNEFSRENIGAKKERKAESYQAKIKDINLPGHIKYGLGKNAYLMSCSKRQLATLLNLRVLGAELFKHEIIFDMGYEKYMTHRQLKECAKQVLFTFAENRLHVNPFHFHLCNYPQETTLDKNMQRLFSDELDKFPLSYHHESYLDVFEKDRLVYLTPDSPYEMSYNPDDVYIIGAFVDTGPSLPLSFAKAKTEKIRTAKFPLDKYLKWKQGTKSLPMNIVTSIVADFIYYRNWNLAFKNIPRRLIDRFDEEDIEILESDSRGHNFNKST